jgi:hypothetical protein
MQRPTAMGYVTGASAFVAAPTSMPVDILPDKSTVSSTTASMKNHPIPPSVFELMRVVRGLVMLVAVMLATACWSFCPWLVRLVWFLQTLSVCVVWLF